MPFIAIYSYTNNQDTAYYNGANNNNNNNNNKSTTTLGSEEQYIRSLKKMKMKNGVKAPIVSIALSQLCDLRVGAHLRLHDPEPAVSCRQLSYVGSGPHLSNILPLPSRHLGWYQIIF